jgi:hypothetical protein
MLCRNPIRLSNDLVPLARAMMAEGFPKNKNTPRII